MRMESVEQTVAARFGFTHEHSRSFAVIAMNRDLEPVMWSFT